MSVSYQAVGWNRQKKIYDFVLVSGIICYLLVFVALGGYRHRNATIETLLIRGFGTAALLLLHIVLCIGPLSRINRKFLPLLYNRRHLGVATFILGLAHGTFALIQFHSQGELNPLVSLFVSNTRFDSLSQFPFQPLGFFALIILFLMAGTSHDFWLHNLSPVIWKRLHMLVYVAYALLIAHVSLGVLQAETSPVLATVLGLGLAIVILLHLAAAVLEHPADRDKVSAREDGFVEVGEAASIPENRARVVCLSGERVAVFRYGDKISAVSNVCRHQNGPLGEGKIIDGCITCPWHGYQYLPDSGTSPPPFTEKVETYAVRVEGGKVFVHPRANPPGTRVEPARIPVGEAVS
ncbi:MAG: ferric reductase-like transmembrane domain-containing protein [Acidobacteriales bacterium]|nr:ferric reductase-like transmembrane domain-containing protein [Terriglobales bacterium]